MKTKKIIALITVFTLILSLNLGASTSLAATEKPVLVTNSMILVLKANPTAYLQVANATSKPSWSSSNKAIATVSKHGTVIAKKVGICKIYCKIGSTTLKCVVKVAAAPSEKTIKKNVKVSYKYDAKSGLVKCTVSNKMPYPMMVHTTYDCYDSNGVNLGYNEVYYGARPEYQLKYKDEHNWSVGCVSIASNSTLTFLSEAKDKTAYIEEVTTSVKVLNPQYYYDTLMDNKYKGITISDVTVDDQNVVRFTITNNGNFSAVVSAVNVNLFDDNNKLVKSYVLTEHDNMGSVHVIAPGETTTKVLWGGVIYSDADLSEYRLTITPCNIQISTPNND